MSIFAQTNTIDTMLDETVAPPTQPSTKVNGFKIRTNESGSAVAIADIAAAVGKTAQYIRQQAGAKKVADCLPDGKRPGRPSGLYRVEDVLPVLEAGVRKGWPNAADLVDELS